MHLRVSRVGVYLAVLMALLVGHVTLAETIPPAPKRYLNDYAAVIDTTTAQRLNGRLESFERESSNQLIVAIFPKLPENTFLEDFTVKTAQSWGVGGKQRDNGIVLFVFIADRKMRIEVGYGLEGKVPDSVAAAIIAEQIRPAFKSGNFARGVEQGIEALISATRGEYQGTGRTLADRKPVNPVWWIIGFFVALMLIRLLVFAALNGDVVFAKRRQSWLWNFMDLLALFAQHQNHQSSRGGSWGGSSGGSWGGSSGGGFSGGGGSFGGGGASGDW
jgi:uncharacterized protein